MSLIDLKVPNIGEFKDVEVIEVLVSEGQSIKKNDPLITIESDKSSVEIPSTEEGKVTNVIVKVGDKISEGSKILEIEVSKSSDAVKSNETIKNQEQSLSEIDVKIEDTPRVSYSLKFILEYCNKTKNSSFYFKFNDELTKSSKKISPSFKHVENLYKETFIKKKFSSYRWF